MLTKSDDGKSSIILDFRESDVWCKSLMRDFVKTTPAATGGKKPCRISALKGNRVKGSGGTV